jgi:hypothetical protein
VWEKQNAHRFDNIMLKTKTVAVEAKEDGLWVKFEGEKAPAEPVRYDMILQSAGRSPNGKKIGAEKAGVIVGERGFIPVDAQMRTNVPHIFAIGDIVGQPMLAHKAVHEAHVAAEVAAGHKAAFDATVIPGVAYTHPEVAWVGYTEAQAKAEGKKVDTAKFPWAASGRAIANGADYGFTKLIFDAETHRVIGGTIVGPSAGDMIGEVCLAIEMGATRPTSARPSTRTRPWARRWAWPPKWRTAVAPTCRRCARSKRSGNRRRSTSQSSPALSPTVRGQSRHPDPSASGATNRKSCYGSPAHTDSRSHRQPVYRKVRVLHASTQLRTRRQAAPTSEAETARRPLVTAGETNSPAGT